MKKHSAGTTISIPAGPSGPNPTPNVGIPALVAGDETAQILAAIWTEPLVIVDAAPGAGKTYRATAVAAHLAHQGKMRVVIATSTRAQAADFASRLAAAATAVDVYLVTAKANANQAKTPNAGDANITGQLDFQVAGRQNPVPIILVTTSAKLAAAKENLGADVLIGDEAYQCSFARLTEIAHHAKRILCIGDPGQIDPITTVETNRFEEQTFAPHKSAPHVLLHARPNDVVAITLSATRRIGPKTTKLIEPMYPFSLSSLRPPSAFHPTITSKPAPEYLTIAVEPQGGVTDPNMVKAITDQVNKALTGFITDPAGVRPVSESDICVVCPHVAQTAGIAAELPDAILVTTADRIQGLERDIVIVHDPLAGQIGCPEFNLNLGRLCVVLSRARAHLIWVTTTTVTTALEHSEHPDAALNHSIRTQLAA